MKAERKEETDCLIEEHLGLARLMVNVMKKKYRVLIGSHTSKAKHSLLDDEDLMGVSYLGLTKAARTYAPDNHVGKTTGRQASFSTYACKVIGREITTYIRASTKICADPKSKIKIVTLTSAILDQYGVEDDALARVLCQHEFDCILHDLTPGLNRVLDTGTKELLRLAITEERKPREVPGAYEKVAQEAACVPAYVQTKYYRRKRELQRKYLEVMQEWS